MHILTKFFVIVASVLSVLLAGLSIAYTHNADAIVQAVKTERARAKAAVSEMAERSAQLAELRDRNSREVQRREAEIDRLRTEINQLEAARTQLAAENKRLELASEQFDARTEKFTAVIDNNQRFLDDYFAEVQQLRQKETTYALREIELTDRINVLTGQLDVSQESNRALQERLSVALERLEIARTSGPGAIDGEPITRRAPANFNGRVTDVRTDGAGRTLLAIDAGTNDLLRERMLLTVVGDGGFVATIRLEEVDLNSAIGVIVTPNEYGIPPRAGQRVVSTSAAF